METARVNVGAANERIDWQNAPIGLTRSLRDHYPHRARVRT